MAYLVFDALLRCRGELLLERPPARARKDLRCPARSAKGISIASPGALSSWPDAISNSVVTTANRISRVIRAPGAQASRRRRNLINCLQRRRLAATKVLMIKDPESGLHSWKARKIMAETQARTSHARRSGHGGRVRSWQNVLSVLSDYTFAVRDGAKVSSTSAKAYSGLTDAEIAEMTKWFLEHTLEDQWFPAGGGTGGLCWK